MKITKKYLENRFNLNIYKISNKRGWERSLVFKNSKAICPKNGCYRTLKDLFEAELKEEKKYQ